jgi:hypothetical protein
MKIEKILRHCRIDKPRHFRLARHEPAECFGLSPDADEVKDMLADGIANGSTRTGGGVYLSSFRAWTLQARTVPSNTSCRE